MGRRYQAWRRGEEGGWRFSCHAGLLWACVAGRYALEITGNLIVAEPLP